MNKIKSFVSAASLLLAAPFAHGDILFQETFESYDPGATSLSSNWTITDQAGVGQMTREVVNNPAVAIEGDQYWSWTYPSRAAQGIPISRLDTTGWRQDTAPGVYTVSQRLQMPYTSGDQTEPRYFLMLRDAEGNTGAVVTVQATSNFMGTRRIGYNVGGDYSYVADSSWPRSEWLMMIVTLDEINRTWSFQVANEAGTTVWSVDDLALSSDDFGQFDTLRLQVQTVNEGRGVNTLVDDIQINGPIPEPGSMSLLSLGGAALLARRRKA